MYEKILFSLLFTCSCFAQDSIPRLSSMYIDEGQVQKLYLTPGRPSVLLFPCNIVSFSKGTGADIDAAGKEQDPKELNLWLKSSGAEPTGLIVRCENKTFVFDIVPSTNTHQDFIKIDGSYGSPKLIEDKSKIILSSINTEPQTHIPLKKKIIFSSKGEK